MKKRLCEAEPYYEGQKRYDLYEDLTEGIPTSKGADIRTFLRFITDSLGKTIEEVNLCSRPW